MDTLARNKMQPVARKVKKKPVKDEVDRQKQAEKKKRRLEKALATSAAIISELEKKKQKKKEEQKRLDEECAATAEAVALHVLIGEDSDDSCKVVLDKDEEYTHWDCSSNISIFTGVQRTAFACQDCSNWPQGIGWISNSYLPVCNSPGLVSDDWSISSGMNGGTVHAPYFQEVDWETTGFSAGLIAAQAVSSLQIAEDAHENTIVLNGMLRH